ncbi:MAG TPA: SPOR domain-containing protein [Burkholderiaceae bacterium]|jgi:cell division protein FtsN|nr:SPOR domain-containing protein [Burkholderiaceae bacterium]
MAVVTWSDRAVVGFLSGLVVGLAVSTAAALYITNSPVPFINKVQRATANVNPAAGGQLPDPNKPLYSNRAVLPALPDPAHNAAPAPIEDKSAPAAGAAPATVATAADSGARVMLQAGAFKSAQDADSMRARLALLGLDARVSQVTQDGGATVLYRVRIGPYRELDDLSGIRRTLAENGIEAQVVHTP